MKSTTGVPLTTFLKTWRTMGTALSVLKKVRKAEELTPISISGRSAVRMWNRVSERKVARMVALDGRSAPPQFIIRYGPLFTMEIASRGVIVLGADGSVIAAVKLVSANMRRTCWLVGKKFIIDHTLSAFGDAAFLDSGTARTAGSANM